MNIAKSVGTIKLGNKATISDPCYEKDVWCSISFDNVLEGEFECYVKERKYGAWGKRVSEMIVVHKDYKNIDIEKEDNYEYCGIVCVDSGTMSITDTAYYNRTHNNDDFSEEWYNIEICNKLCGNYNIADNQCFISTSGLGDGQYEVYGAFDSEDRIYAIKVVFLNEEDEED